MESFFKDRNVLITGAGGFGGSHLTKLLVNSGANVTAFMKDAKKLVNLEGYVDKVRIIAGDVRDENVAHEAVKEQDIIYHFATYFGSGVKNVASASKDPVTTFDVNVLGVVNVVRKAILEKVSRIVFISTCHVYGEQPASLLPLKETIVPNPVDIYSTSKYTAELVLRHFNNDIDIIITRAFNQFGEGHIGDYFVPKVITSVLKGVKPVLWSPNTTRDFSYVGDVIEGYALVGKEGKNGEIYHFCSGKEISMVDMLEVIANGFGLDSIDAEWRSNRPNDFSRSYGDYSKAREQLGWEPKVSIEDGMKRTIEWWRRHPELLE